MGILLMIFTPVPYMDATSSWGFRNRWKRILVGFAGMIVEIFVAAIAVFVWAQTGPGIIHSLAYNMIFIASVSTVLFNINPLLRFDGYYILSDLLEIPNLHQRSAQQLKFLAEKYLFGVKRAESPAHSRKEAFWLTTFGILSWIYRIFVFGMILIFVADRFLLLGIIMAVICLISWIIVPLVKFTNYLASSPRLDRCRPRAVSVAAAILGLLILLLGVVPFPSHFRAPGVIQAKLRTEIVNPTAGMMVQLQAKPGSLVSSNQPLLELANPELNLELERMQNRLAETLARLRQAMHSNAANIKPLHSRLESITNRLDKLARDRDGLVIRARHDGLWVAPGVRDYKGRWLPRGTRLGLVIDDSDYEFVSTVVQEDVDALFARNIHRAEIRLYGQVEEIMPSEQWEAIPAEQRILPSPALGWMGGGEVAVASDDPQGRKAAEPFFEVRAQIADVQEAALFHGRSGKIRYELDWEPLMPRWWRRLRQLLQKRYQL